MILLRKHPILISTYKALKITLFLSIDSLTQNSTMFHKKVILDWIYLPLSRFSHPLVPLWDYTVHR